MAEPWIEVLGVYRLKATDELIRDKIEYSYGLETITSEEDRMMAEEECREFLESIVLIEALVHNRDERFAVGHFLQRMEGIPRDRWQVAYAEAFLTPDGASVIPTRGYDVPPGDLRIAFFLHFWDSSKPLASSYGDIHCPAPGLMPERLERLVPYYNVS